LHTGSAELRDDDYYGTAVNQGLLTSAQLVGNAISPILFGEHLSGEGGEARFGVMHGGGAAAINRAEVALPVNERIAQRELLRHTHECIIHGHIVVWVILAEHFADDTRAFFVRRVVADAQIVHGVEDAAMHGLETVARIGQRARR
jgi:hypothetical protein